MVSLPSSAAQALPQEAKGRGWCPRAKEGTIKPCDKGDDMRYTKRKGTVLKVDMSFFISLVFHPLHHLSQKNFSRNNLPRGLGIENSIPQ